MRLFVGCIYDLRTVRVDHAGASPILISAILSTLLFAAAGVTIGIPADAAGRYTADGGVPTFYTWSAPLGQTVGNDAATRSARSDIGA